MNRVLIHTSPALWPMVEIELDIIQKELDNGSEVTLLYCDGVQLACDANNPGITQSISKRICYECISRRKNSIDWLKSGHGKLKSTSYSNNHLINSDLYLKSIDSFKNIEISKASIDIKVPGVFDAAVASLMTNLRTSIPDINKYKKKFSAYLKDALYSYFLAEAFINKIKPNKIYIFNGRMALYKPWVNLAKSLKTDFFVYEYPVSGFENYLLHKNFLDQDLSARSRAYFDFNTNSNLADSEKKVIGERWFKNRIKRKKQGFENVYSQFQSLNKLPTQWDHNVFNLSFFVSSQDEINVLANSNSSIISNQIDLLREIRNRFSNIHIYVRIHPNLKGADHAFVNELISLAEKDHIFIIRPEDDVDSYELMRKSNLIVSCGSTTGVEAAYLGTPSLLVGSSLFESFKCCIKAESKTILYKAILKAINGDLTMFPKKDFAKKEALRFAWAFVSYGVKPKYFFRKNSYYSAVMVRDGIETKIRSNLVLFIINRLLDLFQNLKVTIIRVINNPEKYIIFSNFTWRNFVKFIFPSIPRR